jgi:hypothetical protein
LTGFFFGTDSVCDATRRKATCDEPLANNVAEGFEHPLQVVKVTVRLRREYPFEESRLPLVHVVIPYVILFINRF